VVGVDGGSGGFRGERPPACPCGCRVHLGRRRRPGGECTRVVSVRVKGGTGAGRRRVRELSSWACLCPGNKEFVVGDGLGWLLRYRRQPGHRYSCAVCGARRPGVGEGV
jgi:hypothetical protein